MPPLVVSLPRELDRSNINSFLSQILIDDDEPRAANIVLDFASLRGFIRAEAVVVLSNLIEYLRIRHVNIELNVDKDDVSDPLYFLDDSGFFERYRGKPLSRRAQPRSTTIPLKLVKHEESFSFLEHEMVPWLRGQTGYPASSFAELKVCLLEIFNNIQDHSGQDIGCLFGQHHPNEERVRIAVSDFGVGIPTNVRKIAPDLNDAEALSRAVIEGFTSKGRPRHRGAGLALLLDNVVKLNRGKMWIYSRKGRLISSPAAESGRRESTAVLQGSYPGTLFLIEVRTDTLPQMAEEREEFEW